MKDSRRLAWLWLLAAAVSSHASARSAALEWQAPAECPTSAHVRRRVEQLLRAPAELGAHVRVWRVPSGYRAQLQITGSQSGERTLEDPRCDVLADAVAAVLALSVAPGPSLVERAPAAEDHLVAAVLAGGSLGILPGVVPGAGVELAWERTRAWRIALRGTYYLSQSTRFAASPVGASFGLAGLSARACYALPHGDWELGPCIGVDLARISSAGFGGTLSRERHTLWWGPSLGLGIRLRVGPRFALVLAADGVAALVRRRFTFSDVGQLHQPAPVALQLMFGPELRF